jgi:hypothetical protein
MDNFPTDTLHDGPRAHEDLTIKEQLEFMRVTSETRPGVEGFINDEGEACWIAESEVRRFITEHGAEHSSNYLLIHGVNWQEDFFHGCTPRFRKRPLHESHQ